MRDIVIIGAGLAGASLACALKKPSLNITIIDAKPIPHSFESFDRPIALNYRSKEILETIGAWDTLKNHTHPIKHIHVSTQGKFGKTRLHAKDQDVEALGYNILLSTLTETLQNKMLAQNNVTLLAPMNLTKIEGHTLYCGEKILEANIIIAADGTRSKVRELLNIESTSTDYKETAIITTLELENDHEHTAYERFTPSGTLALLPLGEKCAELIWVVPTENAQKILAMDDALFLETIQKHFSNYVVFKKTSARSSYSLTGLTTQKSVHGSIVLLGNSAHTLHPIAAQGFNLALRNTQLLADILMSDGKNTLEDYDILQQKAQDKTVGLTQFIRNIFTSHRAGSTCLRSILLQTLDCCPLAKDRFTWQAMGYPNT